ncbi:MAG: hypothetical protein RLZZ297_567, partial [Chloroflexota bacterium]
MRAGITRTAPPGTNRMHLGAGRLREKLGDVEGE